MCSSMPIRYKESRSDVSCQSQLSQAAHTCGEHEIPQRDPVEQVRGTTRDAKEQQSYARVIKSLWLSLSLSRQHRLHQPPKRCDLLGSRVRPEALRSGDENRPLEARQKQRFLDAARWAFITVNATQCKQPCISRGDVWARVTQAYAWTKSSVTTRATIYEF